MKRTIIAATIVCTTLAIGLDISRTNREEKELIDRIYYSEYNPRSLIQRKLDEYKQEKEYNQMIETKQQEIVEYLNSYEYKLRESTRSWRLPHGISVSQLQPTTFKNTAYSALAEENGGWTVTCNGEPLEGNIVANNTLPQGTKIYMNGTMYTVADRGSSRFNNPNRLDVLINRLPGETDNQYRQRVSNFGVQYVQGYIIK